MVNLHYFVVYILFVYLYSGYWFILLVFINVIYGKFGVKRTFNILLY